MEEPSRKQGEKVRMGSILGEIIGLAVEKSKSFFSKQHLIIIRPF